MKNPTIQLNAIQILRAVASIMVVFHHFGTSHLEYGQSSAIVTNWNITKLGASGVDIFFVISGFIMFYTTKESYREDQKLDIIRKFMIKRLLRIYPIYWFWTSIIIILWGAGLILKTHEFTLQYIIASFFLYPYLSLHNNFHPILDQGWTLSFEIYFYILFSAALLANKRSSRILLILALFILIGSLTQYLNYPAGIKMLSTNPILVEFILGAFIAVSFKSYENIKIHPKIIIILGWTLLFLNIFLSIENMRFVFFGIPAGLIVLGNVFSESRSKRLANSRGSKILRFLGDASYSIYLTHGLFTMLYSNLLRKGKLQDIPGDINIILGTVIACVFGTVAYYIIEKPILTFLTKKFLNT